jgi:hypothetical protein
MSRGWIGWLVLLAVLGLWMLGARLQHRVHLGPGPGHPAGRRRHAAGQ